MCVTWLHLFELKPSESGLSSNGVIYERDEADGTLFACFNHDELIVRLLEAFEGIVIGSQDRLLEDARVTESMLAAHGMDNNPLIGSLNRKAKNLGPAIPFSIETEDGDCVRGAARRRDISFRHGSDVSADMLEKIRSFLESFGVGEIEHRACAG
jgi:hypothetical protein